MRGKKTGTGGWIPLENVLDDVLAAPAQDTFASAVNACFIMTRDDLKTKSGNMWSHTVREHALGYNTGRERPRG